MSETAKCLCIIGWPADGECPIHGTEARQPSGRELQIRASLKEEWRLKTLHGINHDHLSDLAFLISELDYIRARWMRLRAALDAVRGKK